MPGSIIGLDRTAFMGYGCLFDHQKKVQTAPNFDLPKLHEITVTLPNDLDAAP